MSAMRLFMMIARIICYAVLAVVIAGVISLFAPFMLGLCRNASGGTVSCTDPLYRDIFEFGFGTVLMTIFTGVPALLAVGGMIFAGLDLARYLRRRRTGIAKDQ